MRIVEVEIENYRGIAYCRWTPAATINCLIGPGDATKTTILDAIELALHPRSNFVLDDADIYELDPAKTLSITVTLAGLPPEFISDNRYGLHLRSWDEAAKQIVDEPSDALEPALSVRVCSDEALEARWSLFNDRISAATDEDPPALRYKDAQLAVPVRLGPYADRHLGWGRQSVLTRLNAQKESVTGQLVLAARAARHAFQQIDGKPFSKIVESVQDLAKAFSVPVRKQYIASLDLQNISLSAGGIALHDDKLPLRRLGTGSSRLLVAAIQRGAGADAPIALIDEIEHGLEPHRIARLVQYLREPGAAASPMQSFVTTHSVVTIREMEASELYCVRSKNGVTTVVAAASKANSADAASRHLRGTPDAFLAQRVIIGEGRTEQGLCRGLDKLWARGGMDSFAAKSVIAVDGGGSSSPELAEHLAALGHAVFVLLDSDEPVDRAAVKRIEALGGTVHEWPDGCAIEDRIFSDVPWKAVQELVHLAVKLRGNDSVLASINAQCKKLGEPELASLELQKEHDCAKFRGVLAAAAAMSFKKIKPWFKSIPGGEELAAVLFPYMSDLEKKPFGLGVAALRGWVDG